MNLPRQTLRLKQNADSLYLRLSVTDSCNLRCRYCRPERERDAAHGTLSDKEILELVCLLDASLPVRKVRLTGGEPLLRPNLPALVRGLRRLLPAARLCMTTNGIFLPRWAGELRRAGLEAVNISLDVSRAFQFSALTRGGNLGEVLTGIGAAREAGFSRVKINSVLLRSYNGERLAELVRIAGRYGCEIRFIELMPLGEGSRLYRTEYLSAKESIEILSEQFRIIGPLGETGTARRYLFLDGQQEIAVSFITPVSAPFCSSCDRLRIDSRGRLFSCLRGEAAVDLATPLRRGKLEEVEEKIRAALNVKSPPEQVWPRRPMVAIGG